jgi:sterol desaturase/sphingolipid hydroxylase (fatty acid hydroxylase superfamily)
MNNSIIYAILIVIVPFFGIASFFYFLFYKKFSATFATIKIQRKKVENSAIKREILYSVYASMVFAIVIYLCIFNQNIRNKTLIYNNLEQFGNLYFIFSILLVLVFHDGYFYWTHRLLHQPFLFKHIHYVHHKSHNPTPYTAFAFHPIEALLNIGVLPAIIFIIPLHQYLLLAWWLVIVTGNIMGHLGYEPFKKKLDKPPYSYFLFSTHHNWHHQKSSIYFGFFFKFWDKIMKTEGGNT